MLELDGLRVATLEARMSGALAALIAKRGGVALCAPAVRESPMDCADDVAQLVDGLEGGAVDIAVFQTGVGARALFREADRQGRLGALTVGLNGVTTVCRGPKPTAALREAGVHIAVGVETPYTTRELIGALDGLALSGRRVVALQYGERNAELLAALGRRGAITRDICLYEWMMPEDAGKLRALVVELLGGRVDAIAFTSQVQIRHLYKVADEMGVARGPLSAALNSPRVIVAAVGPTCAAALDAVGVSVDSQPEYPKMGHMVKALAECAAARRGR